MIANLLRSLATKRNLDRKLRARRVIRMARAEAARKGISTQWKRRAQQARAVMGAVS